MMMGLILLIGFTATSMIVFMLCGAGGELYNAYRQRYVSRTSAILRELYTDKSAEGILTVKVLAALLAAMLAWLLFADAMMPVPIVITVVAAVIGGTLPDMILRNQQARRRKKFNTQLIDAMNTISNGLRSGFSLMQTVNLAVQQLPDPAGQEFRLMSREIELGTRTEDALQNMNRRMNDRDLQLVVASVRLTLQTGGDLPAVFKRLSETIRERNRIEGKIRALTSQGRMQAIVVGLIPPALGVIVYFINPMLMELMYKTLIGWMLITPVMLGFTGWMLPLMPIDNIIATRRRLILADWPFFMDLLTLALESGMDISTGIRRIVSYLPMGPLTEELMRFCNTIQLGTRRATVMREMAARIAVAPITATVEIILQAEELGTELGMLMSTQAAEFREKHARYVEQLALETPVKMLLPLLGCIFPAILIVLVGPVMIQYSMSQ